jgi:DnaJ-class molecular chaperone
MKVSKSKISKSKKIQFGEWQLCPLCLGSGTLQIFYMTSYYRSACHLCNGAKVIVRPIIRDNL